MQDAKEEVRSRLEIEDVIGEYVQLKRAGRSFKGLSPFTSEKTPSFIVSPEKQIWHDFSSGKGGDLFSFVMEVEGVDFRQALEQLARRAGVDLSLYQSSGASDFTKKKQRLHELHSLAARYYQQSLLNNKHAIDYVFGKRGFSKQIVTSFQIGYAPSSGKALVNFLEKRGFTKQELKAAGVVNQYGGDLFRSRMVVPLMDASGRVIGFTGRIIDDEPNAPKYLNTPETLLFDKSRHVFGLSQAKKAIRSSDYAVIVEGNLDVVSSHQAGVEQVIATAGTALTKYHLKSLTRLTSQIRLAFDGDKAGMSATERAIGIAQDVGVELSIVSLPAGANDPDELIKQGAGKWQKIINEAMPAIDWLLDRYKEQEDVNLAAGKKRYADAGIELLKSLKDPVDQEHYLQLMSSQIGISVESLQTKLLAASSDKKPKQTYKQVASSAEAVMVSHSERYQDDLLELFHIAPTTRGQLEGVDENIFDGEGRQAIARYFKTHKTMVDSTPDELQKYDAYVRILLTHAEDRYGKWSSVERTAEVARLLRLIIKEHRKKRINQLSERLRKAELDGNTKQAKKLLETINQLTKEIKYG